MPKKTYQVPIKDIIKIEKTKWHLGKTKNRLLLKVIFTNKKGIIDSIAWLTRDLDQWVKSIEQLLSKK